MQDRDWSSVVCSSDLPKPQTPAIMILLIESTHFISTRAAQPSLYRPSPHLPAQPRRHTRQPSPTAPGQPSTRYCRTYSSCLSFALCHTSIPCLVSSMAAWSSSCGLWSCADVSAADSWYVLDWLAGDGCVWMVARDRGCGRGLDRVQLMWPWIVSMVIANRTIDTCCDFIIKMIEQILLRNST